MPFIIEKLDANDPALQFDEKYQFAKNLHEDHVHTRLVNNADDVTIYDIESMSLSGSEMGFEPGRLILFHHDEYAIIHSYIREEKENGADIRCYIIMDIEQSPGFDLSKEDVERHIAEGKSFYLEARYELKYEIRFTYYNLRKNEGTDE
ncbi:hypothetical protein [Chitinivorax sp. B]|uniref:hypothetical protein n=1 Tax=Chitinivorax sp. B TaxID=2502235 RepID=UPI0010F4B213|nr:hypothetical protein [Chitinivorax sp. B]